jgi:hypothetical protein
LGPCVPGYGTTWSVVRFSGESEIIFIGVTVLVDAIRITGEASDTLVTFTVPSLEPTVIMFTLVLAGELVILIDVIMELLD